MARVIHHTVEMIRPFIDSRRQILEVSVPAGPMMMLADPVRLPQVIINLFTQADRSLERSQGGLGIGLTVVRNLIELHDGSVIAASQGFGQGNVFTVRLRAAALEAAQNSPPQIILPDIGLPHVNGYEVAEPLRKNPKLNDTLIVALTGYGTARAVWPGIGTANANLDGSRVLQSDFGKSVHKIVNECNIKHHVIKSFSLC